MSLRFAMVTTFYPPYNFGGDGIAVLRLSESLVRRGHAVTVIHDEDAYRALADGPMPVDQPAPDGIERIGLRSRLGTIAPLLTHQTGRPVVHGGRIRRILREREIDIVHFHNVSLVGGPGVLSAGDGLKVYTAHEHWLVCPTHVLWRHNREPCSSRQCLRCVLRHRRPPQLWRYTRYLPRQLRHVDVVLAFSEFSRERHRAYGFPREMTILPGFIPDHEVGGGTELAPHPRPYFFFAGRLEPIKGLEDVLAVFRDYHGADLLVAGKGTQAARLRKLAAGAENIRFLDHLPAEQLRTYYRHALAVIVPSVGYETFGFVLVEAFAAGTPVIARRIGSFPEIVERCGGGVLFSTRAELQGLVRRLHTDAQHRAALAARARTGFRTYWSESVVIRRYLAVLRDAARRRGNSRVAAELDAEVAA